MKKFLFLLLGLAVSASAFAGVNSQRITKGKAVAASRQAVATLNENHPAAQKMSKQKNAFVMTPFENNMRPIEKSQLRAPVTQQPEGTVKYYKRTAGTALFSGPDEEDPNSIAYYTGNQDGYVMTVTDGSTVWFKNLIYDPQGYLPDYWIKGSKSGSRITINITQEIANTTQWGNVVLGYGSYTTSGNSISFTPGSTNTIQYSITNSGKTLTLQSTNATNHRGLAAYWEDDNDLIGMEWGTVLEEADDVPETPTMYNDDYVEALDGEEVAYYRQGYAFVYDSQGDSIALTAQDGYAWIFYANDGSVYMRDPVYGFKTNIWVKGTKDGNKISVPLGQYIAWTSNFMGLKTAWGEMGEENFTYDTAGEVTYTIDDQTITLDNSEYSETGVKGLALVLDSAYVDKGWYGYLDFYTTYYVFPDAPAGVTVNPAATTADVSWEPATITQWNLRYREYVGNTDYYSTSFETDEDLAGWHGWDADGDGNWWGVRPPEYSAIDGNCLTSASYSNGTVLTPDNWLVSPQLTLNGVVKFKAWGQDPAYASEIIRVYISNTTDSVNAFIDLSEDITVVAYDSINNGVGNIYQFAIPEQYQGQQGYIAIRHYNVSDMFCVNVDDIYVGNPDVIVPEWNYVHDITEIPYTITGLTPETNYEVQLQSVNAGGTGDWGASTLFTTLAEGGYLRGDVDGSGAVDITDATTLINYLLYGNANPFVEDNADVDYSGDIDITDATTLINYLLYGNWPD